ncbi:hypothetical protein SAMN04488577_2945 [Bacillus sp. cl95]|nr:hypothetical protein SAMN02799634_105175 [Bacillus sp. UNCCL13]SFQ87060.1 hypothetical protein SAMN04488577_2945 [Bacillus sp. cl95]
MNYQLESTSSETPVLLSELINGKRSVVVFVRHLG